MYKRRRNFLSLSNLDVDFQESNARRRSSTFDKVSEYE